MNAVDRMSNPLAPHWSAVAAGNPTITSPPTRTEGARGEQMRSIRSVRTRSVALLSGALLATAAGSLLPAAAVAAPNRQPLPFPTPDPIASCGSFDVHVQAPVDKEYFTTTTLADGTTITRVTGALVAKLTNMTTGKALTINAPGPALVTVHPDGSSLTVAEGLSIWPFDPDTAAAFHVPLLGLYSGRLQFNSVGNPINPTAPPIVADLSMKGRITDLCSALS